MIRYFFYFSVVKDLHLKRAIVFHMVIICYSHELQHVYGAVMVWWGLVVMAIWHQCFDTSFELKFAFSLNHCFRAYFTAGGKPNKQTGGPWRLLIESHEWLNPSLLQRNARFFVTPASHVNVYFWKLEKLAARKKNNNKKKKHMQDSGKNIVIKNLYIRPMYIIIPRPNYTSTPYHPSTSCFPQHNFFQLLQYNCLKDQLTSQSSSPKLYLYQS